jgi:hypothetical protein
MDTIFKPRRFEKLKSKNSSEPGKQQSSASTRNRSFVRAKPSAILLWFQVKVTPEAPKAADRKLKETLGSEIGCLDFEMRSFALSTDC